MNPFRVQVCVRDVLEERRIAIVSFATGPETPKGRPSPSRLKIETLARNLVLALDAGVYTLQRDEKPGQYPGLGYLLGVLRKKDMHESWYRSILTICGNPAGGWNLRNEIAHGFILAAGSPAAALLFQCVIYLWGLGAKAQNVAAGVEAEEDQT